MVFACSGKIRSTPVPKETLRTVIVARAPLPRRPMTTPSKTWTRSRSVSLGLPLISSLTLVSLTRTCTRTVSPGLSRGSAFFRSADSTVSMAFMVLFPSLFVNDGGSFVQRPGPARPGLALDLAQQRLVLGREPGRDEQVGPARARRPQGLPVTPAADAPVVAREQHLGHGVPPPLGGARVVRPVQEASL